MCSLALIDQKIKILKDGKWWLGTVSAFDKRAWSHMVSTHSHVKDARKISVNPFYLWSKVIFSSGFKAKEEQLLLSMERVMLAQGYAWPEPDTSALAALGNILLERADQADQEHRKQMLQAGGTSRSRAAATCLEGQSQDLMYVFVQAYLRVKKIPEFCTVTPWQPND